MKRSFRKVTICSGRRKISRRAALRASHFGSTTLKTWKQNKVSFVQSRYHAAFQSYRSQDHVMRPDHVAGRLKIRPKPGMSESCCLSVGDYVQSLENRPEVTLALCPTRGCRSFDSMPHFGDSDRGDFQILAGLRIQPCDEVEGSLLAFDNYIRIEDYRHRLLGGFKALRAATRSRCHALASLSGRSTFLSACANLGAVQPFLPSGTRRATGVPFLSSTKLTF
jgi:hypothetical protein